MKNYRIIPPDTEFLIHIKAAEKKYNVKVLFAIKSAMSEIIRLVSQWAGRYWLFGSAH